MKDSAKFCAACGSYKTVQDFVRDRQRKDGLCYYCKECTRLRQKEWKLRNPERTKALNRSSHLKKKFGISEEEYENLNKKQNGLCAICGASHQKGKRHAVDHDHKTGKIRGLLCFKCNTSLGQFHSIKLLTNAIKYINENQ